MRCVCMDVYHMYMCGDIEWTCMHLIGGLSSTRDTNIGRQKLLVKRANVCALVRIRKSKKVLEAMF